MESSPKGREIERVEGDAGPIVSRGNDITALGNKMISSAAMLKSIADGASGQKGLAVDKLTDVVGDCYEELDLAGKRYKPTGPILVTYGTVLAEVQPLIATAVKNCEEDWETYATKANAIMDAPLSFPVAALSTPSDDGAEQPDPVKERKDAIAAAQGLADDAHDVWEAEAKIYDSHYDTWEHAFETAATEIGVATKGGIEDSKWDDLDGIVAGALEILKWVGLALAVLGVIIGGPFLAALAAIVAITTLVLTIYAFARGNATVLDLVFAVVGVIPFGSLGKLFNGNKMGFLDDMAGGLASSGGRAAIRGEVGGIVHGLTSGFTRGGGGLSGFLRGARGGWLSWTMPNGSGAGNMISRLFTGQNMNHFSQPTLSGGSILGSAWGDGVVKSIFGGPDALFDLHNKWFPTPTLGEPLFGSPAR